LGHRDRVLQREHVFDPEKARIATILRWMAHCDFRLGGTNALEFLQAIYRSASVPLSVRMRAAIEALSFRRGSLISRGLGYLVDAPPIGRPTPILSGPAISNPRLRGRVFAENKSCSRPDGQAVTWPKIGSRWASFAKLFKIVSTRPSTNKDRLSPTRRPQSNCSSTREANRAARVRSLLSALPCRRPQHGLNGSSWIWRYGILRLIRRML
jgi:hypothetical protein